MTRHPRKLRTYALHIVTDVGREACWRMELEGSARFGTGVLECQVPTVVSQY